MGMQNNLIMHFHCSECGNRLNLIPERECSKAPIDMYKAMSENTIPEPTGALVYRVPDISIEPCRSCIEKYTSKAKKLCDAIKEIKDMDMSENE